MRIINEPGLYNLILRSTKPEAKEFKRWVTHEVLPEIRKTGAYMTPGKLVEMIQKPESVVSILEALKDEQIKNSRLTEQLEVAQPKVPVHGWKG